jgi:ATP synthase protein I
MESIKKDTNGFSRKIAEKEKRKQKALRDNNRSVWFGLGMFGMVGWSVVAPTLLGALLGIWLDKTYQQSFSWTLTFLMLGLVLGGFVAAHWVTKEDKEIHHNNTNDND